MPEQQSPEGNPQDGKPESKVKPKAESRKRKAVAKPEVRNSRSEVENNSARPVGGPHSEINKSDIENPTSEINPLPTAHSKLQIEPMEVHHHPEVEKKGFKEYILEGIMIFLAVSLGFFAENLREHMSDNQRENEFAKALYNELSADSVAAAHNFQIRIAKEKDLDYLHSYFKDSSLTVLPKQLYPALTKGLYMINIYAFEPKDGILSQLKSSGSERYFKSVGLQKLLGDLNVSISNIRYRNEQEYQFFAAPLKPFLLKHYDFDWLDQLRQTSPAKGTLLDLMDPYLQSRLNIKGSILNIASFDRGEAANMVSFYKQMMVSTRVLQLENYIVINHQILQVLRNSYSLKDE